MRYKQFDDFDGFAESIRDVDSKMIVRNVKRRVWSSSAVELGGVDIQLGRLGSGNLAQAGLRDDYYLFYLPMTPGIEYKANGVVLPKNTFAIFEPGREFCVATKDPHNWCAAFIPRGLLAEPFSDDRANAASGRRVSAPVPEAANRFQLLVRKVMQAAADNRDFESTTAAGVAAKEVLKIANSLRTRQVPPAGTRDGRPKVPREQIIDACMQFLEVRGIANVAVADFAAAAEVSERTVRSAFQEYFGVGPARYLALRRLNRIHRALRAADPDGAKVTQILAAHGEWDFGRFAAAYRKMFGELPSETLRESKSVL